MRLDHGEVDEIDSKATWKDSKLAVDVGEIYSLTAVKRTAKSPPQSSHNPTVHRRQELSIKSDSESTSEPFCAPCEL